MKLNTSAFKELLAKFTPVMEKGNPLGLAVHNLVINSSYLIDNREHIIKCVESIKGSDKDMLYQTFSGKLACKLRLPLKGEWHIFQQEEAMVIASSLITEILISNGEIPCTAKGKRWVENSVPHFSTELILTLGGVKTSKDMLKGLHVLPGVLMAKQYGNIKLPSGLKKLFSEVSSIPFVLSDAFNKKEMDHFFSLADDWMKSTRSEDVVVKQARILKNSGLIEDNLFKLPRYFLSVNGDSRLRLYYDFQLYGVRPQGKLYETLMHDSATPKILNESAIDHLKHIIMDVRYHRRTLDSAIHKWSAEDRMWAEDQDLMTATSQKEIGEMLLVKKAAKALDMASKGIPCHYIFGKDLTNSGLIMAGNSFNSKEMMVTANMVDPDKAHDSHRDFGKAYNLGISRDDIKSITNALFHGSTTKAIAEAVQKALLHVDPEASVDHVTEEFINNKNIDTYGVEVLNIPAVAQWGSNIISNSRTQLSWKTPDGYLVKHTAKIVRCPFKVRVLSTSNKAGYREVQFLKTMPFREQINGMPMYGKNDKVHGAKRGAEVKRRGLYADITHSLDATLLRKIITMLLSKGEAFLLKHDDYMVSPDMYDDIIDVCNQFFNELRIGNYYQDALNQIADYSPYPLEAPELLIGDFNTNVKAVNFLQP